MNVCVTEFFCIKISITLWQSADEGRYDGRQKIIFKFAHFSSKILMDGCSGVTLQTIKITFMMSTSEIYFVKQLFKIVSQLNLFKRRNKQIRGFYVFTISTTGIS